MIREAFPFLDNAGLPAAFAHRGGDLAGADKENTMVAFRAAHEAGFRYIETDVVLSADGKVVAIHGSRNKKDMAKTGLPIRKILEGLDYEEIRAAHKIGGEDIPLLAELLAEFPDVKFNIDPKTPKVVRPLGKLISRTSGVPDRVCVGSFNYKRTQAVAEEVGKKICTSPGPLGFLALKTGALHEYLKKGDFACLQLPYKQVNEHMVERAHGLGLDVHVWTVNDRSDISEMLEKGVDGIMSDNLTALKAVLSEREQWAA